MKIEVDPTGTFKGIKKEKLLLACGLLPAFAWGVSFCEPESVFEAYTLLLDEYGFGEGLGIFEGSTLSEDDVLSFEGDPDMAPLATFHLTDEIRFNVYQSAMVSVTDDFTHIVSRMD
jgi:hypothetical protein